MGLSVGQITGEISEAEAMAASHSKTISQPNIRSVTWNVLFRRAWNILSARSLAAFSNVLFCSTEVTKGFAESSQIEIAALGPNCNTFLRCWYGTTSEFKLLRSRAGPDSQSKQGHSQRNSSVYHPGETPLLGRRRAKKREGAQRACGISFKLLIILNIKRLCP